MSRPADPASIAASSPATSSWANSVVDAITTILDDIYGVSALTIPWAALSGVPATFTPTVAAATAATSYGLAKQDGVATSASRSDHHHGTVALPTPTQVGSVSAYDSPATAHGGKRLYVGTSTPTGASEGDVWVKG